MLIQSSPWGTEGVKGEEVTCLGVHRLEEAGEGGLGLQVYTVGEGEGGMICENSIETCILPYVK